MNTSKLSTSGLGDSLLNDLAGDIEREEHAETLAKALGFKRAEIMRYMATNRLEGHVTFRGTKDMLFDWRQKVAPSDQAVTLKQALYQSNLRMLAEEYLHSTTLPASKNYDIVVKIGVKAP